MCGWVPFAEQVSLSVSVGWGDKAFYATTSTCRHAGAMLDAFDCPYVDVRAGYRRSRHCRPVTFLRKSP